MEAAIITDRLQVKPDINKQQAKQGKQLWISSTETQTIEELFSQCRVPKYTDFLSQYKDLQVRWTTTKFKVGMLFHPRWLIPNSSNTDTWMVANQIYNPKASVFDEPRMRTFLQSGPLKVQYVNIVHLSNAYSKQIGGSILQE